MQRICSHPSIFRFGCNFIVKRFNHHAESQTGLTVDHKQRDHALICQRWEEAIIREHRTLDLPFDTMQQETIDTITNKQTTAQPMAS